MRITALFVCLTAALFAGAAAPASRAELMRIAEDRSAPAAARNAAFETLLSTKWEGRDAWYVARFEDPTLGGLRDENILYAPLITPVEADPDRWIPRLATMTKSANKAIRTNAANILATFQLGTARADALRPLVPWLTDAEWASAASMERLRLVQSVGRVKVTEAIPGLQWICRNDDDETMRAYAAEALLELGAPDAMTYVREVLATSTDAIARHELENEIVRSAKLDDREIADAVIAFASAVSTKEKAEAYRTARIGMPEAQEIPAEVTLGEKLAHKLPPRDSLAQLLIARASQPAPEAAMIGRIVARMNLPSVHRWLAARLDSADSFVVGSLVEHREEVAKNAAVELRAASAGGGAARGIAAVIVNDDAAIHELLTGGPVESRKSFFSAARIARRAIDPDAVLRGSKGAEAEAASLLERLNTEESRRALAKLYPGAMFGERSYDDPGHTTFKFFDDWEESLRSLQRTGNYDHLHALAVASYWGGGKEIVVVAEKGDAVMILRPEEKTLPPAAAALVKGILAEIHPDDLPFYDSRISDGVQYEYVSLTTLGGHRLFMNNPSSETSDPYGRLVTELTALAGR